MDASHTDLTEPCNLWRDTASRLRCREPTSVVGARQCSKPSVCECRPPPPKGYLQRQGTVQIQQPRYCFKTLSFSLLGSRPVPLPPHSSSSYESLLLLHLYCPRSVSVLVQFLSLRVSIASSCSLALFSPTPPFSWPKVRPLPVLPHRQQAPFKFSLAPLPLIPTTSTLSIQKSG